MLSIAKPKLNTCWYCEKPRSAAAWRNGRAVCASCDGFMSQGVICIGTNTKLDHDTIVDKIYRDGNWCVVSREEFVRRFGYLPAERFDYIEPARWLKSGLPRFGKHGASHSENTSGKSEADDAQEETIA